ncbi:hypothetical protein LSM04_006221 [Trypanosoma melophagium]|uniref:uncharacterized protein n=1 Tax=Trypanosoma melophagium TaxID=715481 RepID=UPI00351A2E94|nr:hypothetical protein LSM04_006221 [Trypanosoma melophagium]
MVIFLMGPPRAKNGSNKSRSIIATVRYVNYFPNEDIFDPEEFCRVSLCGSFSDPYLSQSSISCIPLRRLSYQDVLEEALFDDRLTEIRRQKELILMAYTNQLEDLVDEMHTSLAGDGSLFGVDTCSFLSRRHSPWKLHVRHNSPSFRHLQSYIHESADRVLASPCRTDFVYALEKRQERSNSQSYTPKPYLISTAVAPPTAAPWIRALDTPPSPLQLLIWREMEKRHGLQAKEERCREKYAGEEVAEYLRLRRALRADAKFHSSKFSSLAELHRRAQEYFEEDVADRERREAVEHRTFMRLIPPERLPQLKLPSVTKSGRPYRCTAVDHEVARAIAMEEKVWNATCDENRGKRYFPQLI